VREAGSGQRRYVGDETTKRKKNNIEASERGKGRGEVKREGDEM
jgi:hypothetical protein